ncbi:hypothetical protein STRTUCAR8_10071 [Streptomyces turgidiscabies Car8]|uniref:Uncharacterized protein n=1 Tax=Streptomyces turgidiscabies (strain Car8) TaxID=698760 RepID=L7F7I8_STRT8|nr:hypothetical protein STRTUCAR8_10071 [Streptomyces turgidiscabies Car8]
MVPIFAKGSATLDAVGARAGRRTTAGDGCPSTRHLTHGLAHSAL